MARSLATTVSRKTKHWVRSWDCTAVEGSRRYNMQTVMTNRDVELRVESSIIYTTDSKAFWRSGNMLVEAARPSATSATRWMRRSIWSPPCTMAEKQKQRKHNHPAKIYAVHLFGWTAFCFVNTAIQWRSEPILPAV